MFGLWSVHIILIIFQLTPYVRNFTWNPHLVPHFGLEPVPSKDGLVFLKNDYENGVCCIVTISYLVISKCNLHLRLEVTRQCSRKRNNLIIPKKHIFTWFQISKKFQIFWYLNGKITRYPWNNENSIIHLRKSKLSYVEIWWCII